jgi:hypothetical protein
MKTLIVCTPRSLPRGQWVEAARAATRINPTNHPDLEQLVRAMPGFQPTPERIAVVTKKYWGKTGVRLTVGFLDNPPADLRAKILLHMNAWAKSANVRLVASQTDPQVRIARVNSPANVAGYWSYVGTDINAIARDQPTLNLQDFTMKTLDSEFYRVVRHETGHTLGFPHEHMRVELVARIDPAKAIAYFAQADGWSAADVQQQVLTPIEESSIRGTAHADPDSIMCYQLPGSIMKDGKPIPGGTDIDEQDYAFAGEIYPKVKASASSKPKRAPGRTARSRPTRRVAKKAVRGSKKR